MCIVLNKFDMHIIFFYYIVFSNRNCFLIENVIVFNILILNNEMNIPFHVREILLRTTSNLHKKVFSNKIFSIYYTEIVTKNKKEKNCNKYTFIMFQYDT